MTGELPETELVLTSPLDRWDLTLRGGSKLVVWAHTIGEEDGEYVFTALMTGDPHFEVEICRISKLVVADIIGGWPR